MGNVKIGASEYAELIECKVRLKLVKDYILNEDFASTATVLKIIGSVCDEETEQPV